MSGWAPTLRVFPSASRRRIGQQKWNSVNRAQSDYHFRPLTLEVAGRIERGPNGECDWIILDSTTDFAAFFKDSAKGFPLLPAGQRSPRLLLAESRTPPSSRCTV